MGGVLSIGGGGSAIVKIWQIELAHPGSRGIYIKGADTARWDNLYQVPGILLHFRVSTGRGGKKGVSNYYE